MFPRIIQNKKIINYWLVFIFLLIFLILIVLLKKYDDELNYVGLNENNKTKILIKEEDIVNLPKKVIYQNKTYDYEIEEVSDDYYMDNNINYKMLKIKGDYKTEDKIINLKFIKGKTQILMQIIKMIKGGIV